ncbi:putative transcriptional regulatory protein [Escovopsis weberi]|uniref:Putative transcriptional regulatory protein n=1 Tax=Escovopsis weberi TaxID=150374 RepID=A0A0M9VUL4_ESCWE|nr:putative transcriptional regulatory protein [Escovopsis weberi]
MKNIDFEGMVHRCIDLFFEYLYPLTPLFGTRSGAHRLAPWANATFILVTAVCAEAAFMLPKDIFPEGESVAEVFLQASRDGLHQHLEYDLENPNANSIAIRYFHSNCLHAIGKPKYSWHIFGEAIRLAQVMYLHDESSLKDLYPIEAEMRRRCFWILYLGDKSAAILNNRPVTIHKYCFDSGISTGYPSGIEDELLGPSPSASELPRRSFIAGFNANVRLWQSAADLLLEIRLLLQHQAHQNYSPGSVNSGSMLSTAERQTLDSLYVRFITCLDDLPPYLQRFSLASSASTPEAKQFVIQTTNLQVTLHCLRMVIEQKFEELSYYAPGLEHADLRKSRRSAS